MNENAELHDGEIELDDARELIWRNVNPNWVDGGKLSSQAFRPTPKDVGKLSGAREGKVTADKHFHEFTNEFALASSGVWAVTVDEARRVEVRCVYDAESESKPEPCPTGHTYLDYRVHGNSKIRRIGSALRDFAEERGRQHPHP
ncbi:hypothetical protein [Nocardia cyriacigeorgica]|uniref:hypothetical protein n=1 Tax=Nocardia cyriacigeorgica TaxID=135487 RepID=UPI0034DAFEA1